MCMVHSLDIKGFPSISISRLILSMTASNGTTSLFLASSYSGSMISLLIWGSSGGGIYGCDYYRDSFDIKLVYSYSSTLSVLFGKGSIPGRLSLMIF